jgi:DNA-directed RNA polymerase sigma subunit (sigma70/sigma32)
MRSTLPLFPTDDGWPYPDSTGIDLAADVPDFDALETLGPHVYDTLTATERAALFWHYGLEGHTPLSMKELAPVLGCTRAEARTALVDALEKLRAQLAAD